MRSIIQRGGAPSRRTFHWSFTGLVLLTSLSLSIDSHGQPVAKLQTPEPDSSVIVVTGHRIQDDVVREEAKVFIKNVTSVSEEGQFARWSQPICVKVIGLNSQHSNLVSKKVYEVSQLVGAFSGKRECRPNVIVTFTADAPALMAAIERRNSAVFRSVPLAERTELQTGMSPVRWWYGTQAEGADGHQIASESAALVNNLDFPRPPNGKYLDAYSSTMIGTKIKVNLMSVSIVVDVTKSNGYNLKAIAAYIALVALSQTKNAPIVEKTRSILGIFAGSSSDPDLPSDITDWDLAYLRAIYKVPPDQPSRIQSRQIAAELVKTMTK